MPSIVNQLIRVGQLEDEVAALREDNESLRSSHDRYVTQAAAHIATAEERSLINAVGQDQAAIEAANREQEARTRAWNQGD